MIDDFYDSDLMDAYLSGMLSEQEKTLIEAKIESDEVYAEAIEIHRVVIQSIKLHKIQKNTLQISSSWSGRQKGKTDEKLDKTIEKGIQARKINALTNNIQASLEKKGFFDKNETHENLPNATQSNALPNESTRIRPIQKIRWLVAASIVIAAISYLFFIGPGLQKNNLVASESLNGQALFAANFTAAADVLSADVEAMLSARGTAANFDNLERLQAALQLYSNKAYTEAIPVLENWLSSTQNSVFTDQVQLYLISSYLAEDKTDKCIAYIQSVDHENSKTNSTDDMGLAGADTAGSALSSDSLITSSEAAIDDALNWYMALALLNKEDAQGSKEYLEKLKSSVFFQEKAKALLSKAYFK